jgi:hypothetical protein
MYVSMIMQKNLICFIIYHMVHKYNYLCDDNNFMFISHFVRFYGRAKNLICFVIYHMVHKFNNLCDDNNLLFISHYGHSHNLICFVIYRMLHKFIRNNAMPMHLMWHQL